VKGMPKLWPKTAVWATLSSRRSDMGWSG
jgi:hypothetical protein